RGLGVTLWSIVQDLGQLEKHYGKEGARGWLESSQIKTFFGVGDPETAKMLSEMLDQSTLETSTVSRSQNRSSKLTEAFSGAGDSWNDNTALVGRRLMTVGEILQMAVDGNGVPDEQLVLARNRPPLRCGMAKYYRRPDMAALVEI